MKNLFLLPTDKPSRLWINNLLQGKLELSKEVLKGSNTAQNIYITNSEEIKLGDWVYSSWGKGIKRAIKDIKDALFLKKVILTTDQDLIADGVQAIDDNFLEWFVKNPSCESVEVIYELNINGKNGLDRARFIYKIIIPQQEPKQETLEEVLGSRSCQYSVIENKLAILYRNQIKIYDAITKQQDKKLYSEEEVLPLLEMLQKCKEYFLLKTDSKSDERADAIGEVLKQFKKK
jgi:hypothetical protein